MSLETLLEAAQFIEETKWRSPPKTRGDNSSRDFHRYAKSAPDDYNGDSSLDSPERDGDDSKEKRRTGGAGTREVHNKLEKNRRAHLKECFDILKKQIPFMEDKKTSNLSVLRGSLKYIQNLKRKEKEYEHELQHLAQEKSRLRDRIKQLKMELAKMNLDVDIGQWMTSHIEEEQDVKSDSTSTASECGSQALSDDEQFTDDEFNPSPKKMQLKDANHLKTLASSTSGHQIAIQPSVLHPVPIRGRTSNPAIENQLKSGTLSSILNSRTISGPVFAYTTNLPPSGRPVQGMLTTSAAATTVLGVTGIPTTNKPILSNLAVNAPTTRTLLGSIPVKLTKVMKDDSVPSAALQQAAMPQAALIRPPTTRPPVTQLLQQTLKKRQSLQQQQALTQVVTTTTRSGRPPTQLSVGSVQLQVSMPAKQIHSAQATVSLPVPIQMSSTQPLKSFLPVRTPVPLMHLGAEMALAGSGRMVHGLTNNKLPANMVNHVTSVSQSLTQTTLTQPIFLTAGITNHVLSVSLAATITTTTAAVTTSASSSSSAVGNLTALKNCLNSPVVSAIVTPGSSTMQGLQTVKPLIGTPALLSAGQLTLNPLMAASLPRTTGVGHILSTLNSMPNAPLVNTTNITVPNSMPQMMTLGNMAPLTVMSPAVLSGLSQTQINNLFSSQIIKQLPLLQTQLLQPGQVLGSSVVKPMVVVTLPSVITTSAPPPVQVSVALTTS
ncbi:uncharacterized protein LOC121368351 [Gigantopelta aegis]|uniref:uncharacterized protein LOC121368351 n=1 Tax=Gigantopelta aegis TaxID=1735272 RepID=UPI001B8881FC|nr:uncharacterized protein LOC121368351 [Gigantopelta aegis]